MQCQAPMTSEERQWILQDFFCSVTQATKLVKAPEEGRLQDSSLQC